MEAVPVPALNAPLGIMIFTLGGLAGAVFYLPFKKVKGWAWESYWMIYAIFGLVIVPGILAFATSPNVLSVISTAPFEELVYCFLCGVAWGFGGLTWGLMIRYLGFGLGLAMGAGLTSAAGTLIPPMLQGSAAIEAIFTTPGGITSVFSAIVSLAGIVFVGMAGRSKELELSEEQKLKAVAEFNFRKGILFAIFSGLMSSAMSFGLQGAPSMQEAALATAPPSSVTWAGMPVLVVVLSGGFVVNFIWCLFLNFRNKTAKDYVNKSVPILTNLVFAAIAGAIWCSQFICFKTGEPEMGHISYIGWAVLMASQILFSQILGLFLGEWKNTGRRTRSLLVTGLLLLISSAIIAGYAGSLG